MTLTFILVGKIKETFYQDGIKMYLERLGRFAKTDFIQIPESPLSSSTSSAEIKRGLDDEAARVLARLEPQASLILFDTQGTEFDSIGFSRALFSAPVESSHLYFVIGGSNGLSDQLRQRAQLRVSAGRLTYVHPLAMLICSEQVYRAFKIKNGESYHK